MASGLTYRDPDIIDQTEGRTGRPPQHRSASHRVMDSFLDSREIAANNPAHPHVAAIALRDSPELSQAFQRSSRETPPADLVVRACLQGMRLIEADGEKTQTGTCVLNALMPV